MNEVPASFDMSSNYTVEIKEKQDVSIITTGFYLNILFLLRA